MRQEVLVPRHVLGSEEPESLVGTPPPPSSVVTLPARVGGRGSWDGTGRVGRMGRGRGRSRRGRSTDAPTTPNTRRSGRAVTGRTSSTGDLGPPSLSESGPTGTTGLHPGCGGRADGCLEDELEDEVLEVEEPERYVVVVREAETDRVVDVLREPQAHTRLTVHEVDVELEVDVSGAPHLSPMVVLHGEPGRSGHAPALSGGRRGGRARRRRATPRTPAATGRASSARTTGPPSVSRVSVP